MIRIIRLVKWTLITLFVILVAGISAVMILIGPWPTYSESHYKQSRYFKTAVEEISKRINETPYRTQASPLFAGWSQRDITPAVGSPMAGYGGRPNELRATGIREPLFVRALALRNDVTTAVIVGADMLQVFPNVLDAVEKRIQPEIGLTNRRIYYTGSHTHCGPGGLAPGFVAESFMGPYNPGYVEFLVKQFADAIIEAVHHMKPARFAHTAIHLPDFIRNRSRTTGTTDDVLHGACFEQLDTGQRLYLARYSAHCTVFSEEMLALNNDYAGAFQRAVRDATGAPLLFMAGAVGSMRPYPPGPPLPEPWTEELRLGFENDVESTLVRQGKKTLEAMLRDQAERAAAMGQALAASLLSDFSAPAFTEKVTLFIEAFPFDPPPAQVRPMSTAWRLSPFAFSVLGIPKQGRIQVLVINACMLLGMPYDFSGEVSKEWQQWAATYGKSLWVTSFSGTYLGYLSPDRYYHELGAHLPYNHNYEIGQMNWFGPNQEAFLRDLFETMVLTWHADTTAEPSPKKDG